MICAQIKSIIYPSNEWHEKERKKEMKVRMGNEIE